MQKNVSMASLFLGISLLVNVPTTYAFGNLEAAKNRAANVVNAANSASSSASESTQDFAARLKKIIHLAQNQQWQEILEIASVFGKDDADSLDYILFQSMSHNAPVDVLQTLLKQGATLQDHFINILAQKNNVELVQALIPHGLNIHGADMFGRNALHHVLEDFKSKEMFDYLISQNVAIDAKMGDKDPLAIALKRATTHQDALYYINVLLKKGAEISSVHKTLLQQVKAQNPKLYAGINLPR